MLRRSPFFADPHTIRPPHSPSILDTAGESAVVSNISVAAGMEMEEEKKRSWARVGSRKGVRSLAWASRFERSWPISLRPELDSIEV